MFFQLIKERKHYSCFIMYCKAEKKISKLFIVIYPQERDILYTLLTNVFASIMSAFVFSKLITFVPDFLRKYSAWTSVHSATILYLKKSLFTGKLKYPFHWCQKISYNLGLRLFYEIPGFQNDYNDSKLQIYLFNRWHFLHYNYHRQFLSLSSSYKNPENKDISLVGAVF